MNLIHFWQVLYRVQFEKYVCFEYLHQSRDRQSGPGPTFFFDRDRDQNFCLVGTGTKTAGPAHVYIRVNERPYCKHSSIHINDYGMFWWYTVTPLWILTRDWHDHCDWRSWLVMTNFYLSYIITYITSYLIFLVLLHPRHSWPDCHFLLWFFMISY
jgi:hypothetical protein